MSPEDIEKLSDQELLQKLEEGVFLEHFETTDEWKWFREACQRVALLADKRLDSVDPFKDPGHVIELQVARKFYRNVVQSVIKSLKNEGRFAYNEANGRRLDLNIEK